MNTNNENTGVTLDTLKLALALLVILATLVGFYVYVEQPLLYRVLGLLLGSGIAVAIAFNTSMGRRIWGYLHDAQIEVRKVVWPTKQETIQTTLIVILMVILFAFILWLLDLFLVWSIGSLMKPGA